jgi:hypothetical protein
VLGRQLSPKLERRYTSSPRLERRYTSLCFSPHPAAASLRKSPQPSDDAESLRKTSIEPRLAEANLNLQIAAGSWWFNAALGLWPCALICSGLQHAEGDAIVRKILHSAGCRPQKTAAPAVLHLHHWCTHADALACMTTADGGTGSFCSMWPAPCRHVVCTERRPLDAAGARQLAHTWVLGC